MPYCSTVVMSITSWCSRHYVTHTEIVNFKYIYTEGLAGFTYCPPPKDKFRALILLLETLLVLNLRD